MPSRTTGEDGTHVPFSPSDVKPQFDEEFVHETALNGGREKIRSPQS